MFRKIAVPFLALAWLCANGAHWDVMQVVAWGRMFAGYSQTMSLSAALQKTFDPAKPCKLCRTVAKGREATQKQLPAVGDSAAPKLVLALSCAEAPMFASEPSDWIAGPLARDCQRTEPVPVPPPRV